MILSERKNSEPQDYDDYRMSKKEIASAVGLGVLIVAGVAFLCYDSFWAMILIFPYIPYCLHNKAAELKERRKWQLNLQFRDAIRSLSAVLESGYSIENAVAEAYNDLKLSYEEDAMIMKELKLIMNMLRSNVCGAKRPGRHQELFGCIYDSEKNGRKHYFHNPFDRFRDQYKDRVEKGAQDSDIGQEI